ncbi:hypothetical protein KY361_05580 [Candidatus Woesearchaeota archaeon]|nr:hypothetical protein [Candidatus Woesearchaeota archaeon]
MTKELDVLVAVHGLSPAKQIDMEKLGIIERSLRDMGKVTEGHKIRFPVVLVRPDESLVFLDSEKGNGTPYEDKQGVNSLKDALDIHDGFATESGYPAGGVIAVLTPEFRRYPAWPYERKGRLFDMTDMYHDGPDLSQAQREVFARNKDRSLEIYSLFSDIYEAILTSAGVGPESQHPLCYHIAIGAAAEGGHLGETFTRGIREMTVEIARTLKLGEDLCNAPYNVAANMEELARSLKATPTEKLKELHVDIGGAVVDLERVHREYVESGLSR